MVVNTKHLILILINMEPHVAFLAHIHRRVFKKKHPHITEMGLTLLCHAKMPLSFLLEAFTISAYLINNLPSLVIQNQSPYELLYLKRPLYTHLKPFSCASFAYLQPYSAHKLNFHTTKCVFNGYSLIKKATNALMLTNYFTSLAIVQFNEAEFAYCSLFPTSQNTSTYKSHKSLPLSIFLPSHMTDSPSGTPSLQLRTQYFF